LLQAATKNSDAKRFAKPNTLAPDRTSPKAGTSNKSSTHKSPFQQEFSPPMSEEELAEEIGFSEESLEEDVPGESRDYLASLSNEKI
jgi:hypothetical protein